MLAFSRHGSLENPPLVFLHGFLGSKEDWEETISYLEEQFCCYSFDLPDHSHPLLKEDNLLEMIHQSIKRAPLMPFTAIGYSMGGRILLMLAKKYPSVYERLILIGANLGIADEREKVQRWQADLQWIEMLKTKPLSYFLQKWYEQPLFDSLKKKEELFQKVLKQRLHLNPQNLIYLIELFSTSKQPLFDRFSPTTFFLYGEEDVKYATLYHKLVSNAQVHKVSKCGHAVHLENAAGCAEIIQKLCEVSV